MRNKVHQEGDQTIQKHVEETYVGNNKCMFTKLFFSRLQKEQILKSFSLSNQDIFKAESKYSENYIRLSMAYHLDLRLYGRSRTRQV
jgi:hypothetical protein